MDLFQMVISQFAFCMFTRVYNLLVLSKWRNAMVINVVGGLEHFLFFYILGMSSSQLTFTPSLFRGAGQPPTSYYGSFPHSLRLAPIR